MTNKEDYERASGNRQQFEDNSSNNNDPDPLWKLIILVIALMLFFGCLFYVVLPWIFSLLVG